MRKTYCLLNHKLSEKQIKELEEKFDSKQIIYPNDELSLKWSQIPTTQKIDRNIIKAVIDWLSDSQKDDCLIVQGEMGSVFMLVDYALNNDLKPLHAVSERKTVEKKNEDGTSVKTAIFEHVCFREYERWSTSLKVSQKSTAGSCRLLSRLRNAVKIEDFVKK